MPAVYAAPHHCCFGVLRQQLHKLHAKLEEILLHNPASSLLLKMQGDPLQDRRSAQSAEVQDSL